MTRPAMLYVRALPWSRAECMAAVEGAWEPLEWRELGPWQKGVARLGVRFELDFHDRLYSRFLPGPQPGLGLAVMPARRPRK